MSYPLFALIFLGGFALTLLLVGFKAAGFRLSWLVVLAPFTLAWFIVTYDWISAVFLWHYHPPFPWGSVSLCAFIFLVVIVLLRLPRSRS